MKESTSSLKKKKNKLAHALPIDQDSWTCVHHYRVQQKEEKKTQLD